MAPLEAHLLPPPDKRALRADFHPDSPLPGLLLLRCPACPYRLRRRRRWQAGRDRKQLGQRRRLALFELRDHQLGDDQLGVDRLRHGGLGFDQLRRDGLGMSSSGAVSYALNPPRQCDNQFFVVGAVKAAWPAPPAAASARRPTPARTSRRNRTPTWAFSAHGSRSSPRRWPRRRSTTSATRPRSTTRSSDTTSIRTGSTERP